MMNLLNPTMNLYDIESVLEHYCLSTLDSNVIITRSIPLSWEDYALMHNLLHNFVNMTGDVSAYSGFHLTLLVTWIMGEKFAGHHLRSQLWEDISKVPQHHMRYYIDMFASTFNEFYIETFDEDYDSLDGICRIISRHATYPAAESK